MSRGILKNPLKCALVIGGGLFFIAGAGLTVWSSSNVDIARDRKQEIITLYKTTQEYRDMIDKKVEAYYQALQSGAFSKKEYDKMMLELPSDEFAEKYILLESDNEEIKSEIASCEEFKDRNLLAVGGHFFTTIASGISLVVGVSKED